MSSLILVLLALKVIAFVVVSSEPPTKGHFKALFGNLAFDNNGDCIVDTNELSGKLMSYDENKDDKIDMSEFQKFLGDENEAFLEVPGKMLELFDLNKSGFIEKEDAARVYQSVDVNGSSKIEDEELLRILVDFAS